MHILEKFDSELDLTAIKIARRENSQDLTRPHWDTYHQCMRELLVEKRQGSWTNCQSDSRVLDLSSGLILKDPDIIEQTISVLTPWRKGPFKVGENLIDAEWQSWMKWERLLPALPELEGLKIADIGSGNGYFMFNLAKLNPEMVIGFERSTLAYHQFQFLQRLAQDSRLQMEFLTSDHLPSFESFFDVILCMGVAYHSRNPLMLMEQLRQGLKPGGLVFLEGQIWPGEGSFCFFNEERYSKAKNIYFIPTLTAFAAWLKKSGFKNVEVISVDKTTLEEQRRTALARFESLEDYLDPDNSELTVEGHPAPIRALLRAEKI